MNLPACKRLCLFGLMMFLAGNCAIAKNEFWEKKEYTQWSQKEAQKLLQDSPWAKQLKLQKIAVMQSSAESRAQGGETQPYMTYHVQFRTARPVREAMVRQMQIIQKYDSMSPEQKQEFDKRTTTFISANSTDAVIISVSYETNSQTYDLEMARHWQSRTTDLLKNSVYLIPSKGEKVALAQYAVAQGAQREFQFVFPRQVDGKPVISPEDKSIRLEFPYPIVDGVGDGRAFMEFKVEKMMVNGEIVF